MGENTTYEEITRHFRANIRVTKLDLPKSEEGWLDLMTSARMEYNMRLDKEIKSCDITETLSVKLNDQQLMLFSECMKLIILKNMLSDFISVWEVFNNDLGRRNYREQKSGRENLVKEQEKRVDSLADKLYDEFDLGV